jgi:hypothetical protein
MHNRSPFRLLALALLGLAAATAIGVGAYNAGMAHGLAQGAQAVAPHSGAPYVYVWPRPWGFGFLPVFPLFFFVLFLFFVVRGALWGGPWRRGWGCGAYGVPPALDEWHRRAHGGQTSPDSAPRSTT